MNRRPSKRAALLAIGAVSLAMFLAGMAAFWVNRNHTLCSDGKPPLQQRGGVLGQVAVRCQNGQVVTLNN